MSIKPILFNTEMVQAILEGRKTQTRRAIKLQYGNTQLEMRNDKYGTRLVEAERMTEDHKIKNPDGTTTIKLRAVEDRLPPYQRGDILWVRETWNGDWCDHYIYKADGGCAVAAGYAKEPRWRPSIHMPREAARIFLRVANVRVERLQDISVEDCKREGIWDDYNTPTQKWHDNLVEMAYPRCFAKLWDSTIKPAERDCYDWNANPWVWVIEFERCDKPEGWGQGKS